MPNPFAYFALLLWIPIGIGLFALLDARIAAVVCLIGGMLFLPERVAFEVPLIPLDKSTIPTLCVLVGCLIFSRRRLFAPRRGFLLELLVGVLLLSAFATGAFNRDELFYGPAVVKGLDLHDDIAFSLHLFVTWGMPFLLGIRLFRAPGDLKIALSALVVGAVVYIPLILFELRLSPQLHNLVYGFFPHDFIQTIRYGGYRPQVFLGHGLTLAYFLSTAIAAAIALSRARLRISGYSCRPVGGVLLVILVLCKSAAAIIYGVVTSAVILLLKPRVQLRVAVVLAAIVIAYPVFRFSDLFPTKTLAAWADAFSTDRADSLEFRFQNEDLLLARASVRPLFGWGSWGRHRVLDPETGRDLAVTDGMWVIVLGMDGIVGFLCVYGLLLGPVFWALLRVRHLRSPREQYLIAGTALIVTFAGIDSIPNVTYGLSFFLAGALAGGVGGAHATARVGASSERETLPKVVNRVPTQGPPEPDMTGSTAQIPEAGFRRKPNLPRGRL